LRPYRLPPAGSPLPPSEVLRSFFRAMRNGRGEKAPLAGSFKDYLRVGHVLFVSSGTAALWLILKGILRLRPGKGEVIIPAYTCPAVAAAVLRAGLKPVLCDIELDNFGLDPEELKRKVNARTLAVVVVHLLGYPNEMKGVKEICQERGIFLIEDAAQAFGNFFDSGERIGTVGDAGFFSFGRGKPLSLNHGGAITTNRSDLFVAMLQIYNEMEEPTALEGLSLFGTLLIYSLFFTPYLYWIPSSLPFLKLGETIFKPHFPTKKMNPLLMALVRSRLSGLQKEREMREEKVAFYLEELSSVRGVRVPARPYPFLRFPLLVLPSKRDRILEALKGKGTGAALFYPCPLNEQPGLREVLKDPGPYPGAKELSQSLITLPLHPRVSFRMMRETVKVIRERL